MDNLIQVLDGFRGLGSTPVPPSLSAEKMLIGETFPPKTKQSNDSIRQLQLMLGVQADGIIGPKTRSAIKNWQQANSLTPTGIWDAASKEKVVFGGAVSVAPPPGTGVEFDWNSISPSLVQPSTPPSIGPRVTPSVPISGNKLQAIMDKIKGKAPVLLMVAGAGIILYAVVQRRSVPAT